jgi:exo-1,4-beta-D-glucosaminidase
VMWEDNYFSLLPSEERIVTATYDTATLHGARPVIQVGGFNIVAGEVAVAAPAAH